MTDHPATKSKPLWPHQGPPNIILIFIAWVCRKWANLCQDRTLIAGSALVALFTTIYRGGDNIVVHHLIVMKGDELTASFAYLCVGSWVGIIVTITALCLGGGQWLDKEFRFNNLVLHHNLRMHGYAFVSGFTGAIGTLFFLWGNQRGDTGAIGALYVAGTLFWIVILDALVVKSEHYSILLPCLGVVIGSFFAAFESWNYSGVTLGIVFVASGLFMAASEMTAQQSAKASDGASAFFWRFLWLTVTATAIAYIWSSSSRSTTNHLELLKGMNYNALHAAWSTNMPLILPYWSVFAAIKLFVFLALGQIFTLEKDNTASRVTITSSFYIIGAVILTLGGNQIYPGLFGPLPTLIWVWMARIAGAIVLIASILHLPQSKKEHESVALCSEEQMQEVDNNP